MTCHQDKSSSEGDIAIEPFFHRHTLIAKYRRSFIILSFYHLRSFIHSIASLDVTFFRLLAWVLFASGVAFLLTMTLVSIFVCRVDASRQCMFRGVYPILLHCLHLCSTKKNLRVKTWKWIATRKKKKSRGGHRHNSMVWKRILEE